MTAVLKAATHRFLVTGEVGDGSVIVLKEYEVRRGKRLSGKGEVLYVIGWVMMGCIADDRAGIWLLPTSTLLFNSRAQPQPKRSY